MDDLILRTGHGRLRRTRFGVAALVLTTALTAAACGDSDDDGPSPDDAGRVTITLRPAGAATPQDLDKTREVLAARLDFAEVENGTVRVTGDTVTVEAPGESREILDGIARIGRLDFRPVLDARPTGVPPVPGSNTLPSGTTPEAAEAYAALDCARTDQADAAATAAASVPDAPATGCLASAAGAPADAEALLLGASELTGDELQSAKAQPARNATGGWEVLVTFAPDGTAKFGAITGKLAANSAPANRFAVLLDGRVIVAPSVVQELSGGDAVITGSFTAASAKLLAAQLSSGTLPVPLAVESAT
ncbi:hypothetical protein LO772_25920 [Yinghuangia sp. ASG 101]|uniref:SecDF P1 head subdomain-containing protein n=1 Tax=Yinghuangia sp. ASG 101 TaxID=2896848 RepID=UPI001E50C12F|nr:hypothetical protein [Yinghuangia sp. ASG 101]UGQ10280.1 hypothetical protein LO772_25920 [Yinghuangia sp. ASG 101]